LSWFRPSGDLFLANIFFGIGSGIAMPSIMTMTVIVGNKIHFMGSTMSLLPMRHRLGMLLGPILTGVIMETFQLETGFILGTIIVFLGAIISFTVTADFHILAKIKNSNAYGVG
jgi:MFS transporter, DHA1 family, multidrug resistance protein